MRALSGCRRSSRTQSSAERPSVGHALDRDLRHQPPRVLVEPGEDRRQRHPLVPPGHRLRHAQERRRAQALEVRVRQLVEGDLDARRPLRHEREQPPLGRQQDRRLAAPPGVASPPPPPPTGLPSGPRAPGAAPRARPPRRGRPRSTTRASQACRSTAFAVRTSAGQHRGEERRLAGRGAEVGRALRPAHQPLDRLGGLVEALAVRLRPLGLEVGVGVVALRAAPRCAPGSPPRGAPRGSCVPPSAPPRPGRS